MVLPHLSFESTSSIIAHYCLTQSLRSHLSVRIWFFWLQHHFSRVHNNNCPNKLSETVKLLFLPPSGRVNHCSSQPPGIIDTTSAPRLAVTPHSKQQSLSLSNDFFVLGHRIALLMESKAPEGVSLLWWEPTCLYFHSLCGKITLGGCCCFSLGPTQSTQKPGHPLPCRLRSVCKNVIVSKPRVWGIFIVYHECDR